MNRLSQCQRASVKRDLVAFSAASCKDTLTQQIKQNRKLFRLCLPLKCLAAMDNLPTFNLVCFCQFRNQTGIVSTFYVGSIVFLGWHKIVRQVEVPCRSLL